METKEEWLEAARNDTLAEYELETGDIIVTDWEGEGEFFPYVIPKESSENSDIAAKAIKNAIKDELGFEPSFIEWGFNGTYVVHADKP